MDNNNRFVLCTDPLGVPRRYRSINLPLDFKNRAKRRQRAKIRNTAEVRQWQRKAARLQHERAVQERYLFGLSKADYAEYVKRLVDDHPYSQ
jgi:hypothetical protein